MSLLVAALAAGFLTWSATTRAGESFVTTAVYTADPGSTDSGVRTVRYTTGKAGHKLKWLPSRPSQGNAKPGDRGSEIEERVVQYTAPTQAGPVDPFDDPFGDTKAASQASPPKTILHDEMLEGGGPQPLAAGSLPQITIDEPAGEEETLGPPKAAEQWELDESLALEAGVPEVDCSSLKLKRINEITHDISAPGDLFPKECTLDDVQQADRTVSTRDRGGWDPITFTWKASGLCHKPLYFEDAHLERYGHSWGPYAQPIISGGHFFLTVPVLPYKMGLYPPNECVYSLGYYRPGSCAPYMLDPLPLSIRAAIAEAGAWTGAAFLVP